MLLYVPHVALLAAALCITFPPAAAAQSQAAAETAATPSHDPYAAGYTALEAGDLIRAKDLLTQATSTRPDHPYAWLSLGRLYVRLGDFEQAQGAFEKQIAVNPRDPYAFNHLGMVLSTQRRFAAAERAFRTQIEIAPLDKLAHRNLGGLLLDLGRFAEALSVMKATVALDEHDVYSQVQLGRAYLGADAVDKALAAFDVAIQAAPGSPLILNEAAWRLAERGVELPRARVYAERGVAMVGTGVGAATAVQMRTAQLRPIEMLVRLWDTLGWIAFLQDDLPSARLFLEASHAWSDRGETAMHVGVLREKDGRAQDALSAYVRAAAAPGAPAAGAGDAIARLRAASVTEKGADEDLASRGSTVSIAGVAGPVKIEFVAKIGSDGRVDEIVSATDATDVTKLAAALRGALVPGTELARARQWRLARAGSATCTSEGVCSVLWHRFP